MKNSHIVILAVIILAGAAWYYFDKKKKALDDNPKPTPNPRIPTRQEILQASGGSYDGSGINWSEFASKSESVVDSRAFTAAGNKGGRAIVNSNRVLVLS